MKGFDYEALTPGIRRTVRWLHEHDFETTDSGDGVTNVRAGIDGACEEPMVVCAVPPALLASEADRLSRLCAGAGIVLRPLDTKPGPHPRVEASYSPQDGFACLFLWGVGDADLVAAGVLT